MRKNLTISLSPEDWTIVSDSTAATGQTYSSFFHGMIQSMKGREVDPKVVAKYRPLFKPQETFLASRARVLSKSAFLKPKQNRS